MSNLYARLKTISKAKPTAIQEEKKVKECAEIIKYFDIEPHFLPVKTELAQLCAVEGIDVPEIENIVFLDTETTGLGSGAGTVAFLVGIGWLAEGRFESHQLWMRDYDEEEDLLKKLDAYLGEDKTLVTFNGKTFDIPLLQSRHVMQRLRMKQYDHIDLLTHARRIYKLRLKRVNLSHLEEVLLGHERHDDIPGSMIPQRYFDFLKSRDESLLKDIFDHNAQDIVSLSRILKMVSMAYTQPETLSEGMDVFSLGKGYERMKKSENAEKCYKLAQGSYRVGATTALSLLYKRQKRMDEAIAGFESIAGESPKANEELAKFDEHIKKDYKAALMHTDAAIRLSDEEADMTDLLYRRSRIVRKLVKEQNKDKKDSERQKDG